MFVLVHGIGVSSRYFERLVPALAEEGRVVAVDLPGFGKAKPIRPKLGLSIEEFADSVARAMDRLGVAGCGRSSGTPWARRSPSASPTGGRTSSAGSHCSDR